MPFFIWSGRSGCLLPLLIIFNLFFGKLFIHSTPIWLSIEGGLILLFILQMHLFIRRISRQSGRSHRPYGKVIDIEGKVIEEREKLK